MTQAHSAFSVLASRQVGARPFKLFLSMDMNVLPSTSEEDAQVLLDKVVGLMSRHGYLRYQGRLLLSTFGGHDKVLGGWGWEGFLHKVQAMLNERVRRLEDGWCAKLTADHVCPGVLYTSRAFH